MRYSWKLEERRAVLDAAIMANQRNSVRIIGGKWRGRKLSFPSFPDLRPTADRARETLFNWLAPRIADSRCLDLFAGSGSLGFEAISRGAAHATLVEVRSRVLEQLSEEAMKLVGADRADGARALVAAGLEFVRADARAWLDRARPEDAPPYDIVFLDPPFASNFVAELLRKLQPLLAHDAVVYLERPSGEPLPPLPDGWTVARQSRVGDVEMRLIAVGA